MFDLHNNVQTIIRPNKSFVKRFLIKHTPDKTVNDKQKCNEKKELNMPHWYCACAVVDAAGAVYIYRTATMGKKCIYIFVYYVRIVDITWRGDGVERT